MLYILFFQARMNKNDYDLARNDFTKVIELDPTNTAAKKQITIANQKLKVFNDKQKKLYSGMFEKFAAKDSKVSAKCIFIHRLKTICLWEQKVIFMLCTYPTTFDGKG